MSKTSYLLARRRVFLSWIFGLVFIYLASRPAYQVPSRTALLYLVIGLEIALLGEGLRIWASGYLYKGEALAVNGPFGYTRNPLYLGSFLVGFGFCLATGQPLLLIAFMLLFVLVFLHTIRNEESVLQEKFGAEFTNYKQSVPIFIPSPKGYASNVLNEFSWQQVKKNKEYQAAIGVLLLAAYMVVRFLMLYNAAAPVKNILG